MLVQFDQRSQLAGILTDVTLGMTTASRAFLANVWVIVTSLEAMFTVMTGCPSMFNKGDCTISVVQIRRDEEESSVMTTQSEEFD